MTLGTAYYCFHKGQIYLGVGSEPANILLDRLLVTTGAAIYILYKLGDPSDRFCGCVGQDEVDFFAD